MKTFLSVSLTLATVSCLSLLLALLFRFKFNMLKKYSNNLTVKVFNKTYNVFDPFPRKRRLVSTFLTLFPLLVTVCTGAALFVFLQILAAGLLLNLVIVVVSVNLLVIEGAFEVYQNGSIFVKAFQRQTALGEGDVRVSNLLNKSMVRLSNYYLGLAIIFGLLALVLQYTLSSISWAFEHFMDLVFQVGIALGYPPYTVPLVWTMIVVAITFLVRKINNKFLKVIYTI